MNNYNNSFRKVSGDYSQREFVKWGGCLHEVMLALVLSALIFGLLGFFLIFKDYSMSSRLISSFSLGGMFIGIALSLICILYITKYKRIVVTGIGIEIREIFHRTKKIRWKDIEDIEVFTDGQTKNLFECIANDIQNLNINVKEQFASPEQQLLSFTIGYDIKKIHELLNCINSKSGGTFFSPECISRFDGNIKENCCEIPLPEDSRLKAFKYKDNRTVLLILFFVTLLAILTTFSCYNNKDEGWMTLGLALFVLISICLTFCSLITYREMELIDGIFKYSTHLKTKYCEKISRIEKIRLNAEAIGLNVKMSIQFQRFDGKRSGWMNFTNLVNAKELIRRIQSYAGRELMPEEEYRAFLIQKNKEQQKVYEKLEILSYSDSADC